MTEHIVTLAERPELEAEMPRLHSESWPAFVMADPVAEEYWGALFSTFAEYQYVAYDDGDTVLAAGHGIPLAWDGSVTGLPSGWDDALERGFKEHANGSRPTALVGLSIVIAPGAQGKGLSDLMIRAMKEMTVERSLSHLIIPLRPSLKSRYPLIPMERYMRWTRDDGAPFDPWLRAHMRLGASILCIATRSMVIQGAVAQWEAWTGMRFPESGAYPVPGALQPISIDCEHDSGVYEEPNLWIQHQIS